MSSPAGARTLLVPLGRGALDVFTVCVRTLRVSCGRGALDLFTTWGPNFASAVRSRSARCLHRAGPEYCGYRVVAERSMSSPSVSELCECGAVAERPMSSPPGARTFASAVSRGALDVFTIWGPNFASAVRSRSVRCLHRPYYHLRGCRAVAERSMSPSSGARTLRVPCVGGTLDVSTVYVRTGRVPCGRGAPDAVTTWVPNIAGAVRSRSARCLHHVCPNMAGAVWSRSARCLHTSGPEHYGCRVVAERSMSSPPGAPNFASAVWSRTARCLHHPGPERCGCRAVAEQLDVSTIWCPKVAGAV